MKYHCCRNDLTFAGQAWWQLSSKCTVRRRVIAFLASRTTGMCVAAGNGTYCRRPEERIIWRSSMKGFRSTSLSLDDKDSFRNSFPRTSGKDASCD